MKKVLVLGLILLAVGLYAQYGVVVRFVDLNTGLDYTDVSLIQFELELDPPSGDLLFGPMPPLTTVEIADIGAGIPSSYITFDLANFANPYLPTSDVRVTIWDGASPPSTVIYNVAIDLDPAGGFMGWGPYFGGLGGDPLQVEPDGGGIPGTGSGTSVAGELVVINVVPINLPTTRIVVDPDVTFDPTLTDPVTVDVVVAGDHQVATPPPYPENVLISYLTTFTGTTTQTFNMVLSYSGYGIVLDELCWWNGTEWICEDIGEIFDDLAETVSFSITPLTRDGVYEFVLGGNADQEIIVTELLPVEFIQTINETETINFLINAYDPDGNDLEYSWQLDGVEVSTEASYDFETDYTSAGIYVVTLYVTDNYGTRNELNYTWDVTVYEVDQEIVVNEILPPEGDVEINETETIEFSIDAYDPDGNDLEYSWQVDNVDVSTEASYDFETDYTSAGVYVVTLYVTDNYGTRNELNYTWDVTVNDVDQEIVVNEILPPEGDVEIDETETIEFSVDAYDPDGNDLEYSWQLDGVEVSTEASYDFETDNTSAGVYVVTLDVTDNFVTRNELNYTWNVTVNDVSGSGEIIIPNITKLYQNHPNPFNPETNIQFEIKENETGILTIFNTKGQIVASQSFNSGSHIYLWNASKCSSGVYFYKLQTESIIENKKMLLLK